MNIILKSLLVGLMFGLCAPASAQVRIKDIVTVEGVRSNHLVGYGLVVGLNGTGDSLRNAPFTQNAIEGMLERLGIGNLSEEQMRTANTAAVMVTASLPAFARAGSTIDVVVSSLGDSSSLRGGTLIVTPLSAADGEIYAVAQGPIAVAGYAAQGLNASIVEGVPTGARIDNGAIVEREVPFAFKDMGRVLLALRNPDFVTAKRVEKAINDAIGPIATALDPRTIAIEEGGKVSLFDLMADIEPLLVEPDQVAKVVIDARSGTIVIGADVRIDRVAVSQGGLTVTVRDDFDVSQPEALSIGGTTVIVPNSTVEVEKRDAQFAVIDGSVSLQRLVDGLNAIGVGATETISILQAIKAAGALHADLEII
ncbi:flagellar P-ring protein precursor FlgI [Sulfitobacter marinus]|uniref:Flagellar P-ring protein n=1 Tax=Sulfitobacter marinus TaxID=394264 RepID=A0A1I6V5J0_9RHOB|nr:flagellar basal body P-ring protein FlgI [Sulfitobacter marinus]SFT08902.1 flagellar P-ring protein precursor FlgI [Sulfitobacter marinus]